MMFKSHMFNAYIEDISGSDVSFGAIVIPIFNPKITVTKSFWKKFVDNCLNDADYYRMNLL